MKIQRINETVIFTENDKSVWLHLNREDGVIKITDAPNSDSVILKGDTQELSLKYKLINKALNWAKNELTPNQK